MVGKDFPFAVSGCCGLKLLFRPSVPRDRIVESLANSEEPNW